MTTIYLASGNAHKLEELTAMFSGQLAPGGNDGLVFAPPPTLLEVEETGATFAANARLKAAAGAQLFGAPCLADDSGLCVDALDGRPGVYSARYAPTNDERIAKLLGELAGVPTDRRGAAFVCAIALVWPDGRVIEVAGRCEGVITEAPRGTGGFGYDPVFLVPALGRTFAELQATEKNRMSHRALAVSRLRAALAASKP